MKTGIVKFIPFSMAGLVFLSCQERNQKENHERPNILFIMSDDHAYQAISAYDNSLIQTPNIDRLADEGALFTRFSVTNSICAPSRAVLLTGQHSFMNGKVDNHQPFNWELPNFPKLMQAEGYQTAMIGKIHLDGLPQGFDYSAVLPGQGTYYNPEFIINGETTQTTGYVTDIITGMTLDWLESRDEEKPFCVFYHHKAPHREWLPANRHYKEFTQKEFRQPETLFDDYKGRGKAAKAAEMNILHHLNWAGDSKIYPETMNKLNIPEAISWDKDAFYREVGRMNEEQRAAWDSVYMPINEEFVEKYASMSEKELMNWRYQRYMQDYLGTIASVDEGVGQVLDYLDQNNLTENTIVVYTSDQGFYLGEHGWFDKRFMYEESFRTPMLIRYPKEIRPGTKVDKLVQNLDFAPTFLDYSGINIPKSMQGESFRKLVNGQSEQWRDVAYYTYYEYPSVHMVKRHYGIATSRYKLMHFYYDIHQWEMYDLKNDPDEMQNVYNYPEYAEVRKILHKKLEETREYYGDSDEKNVEFLKSYLNYLKEIESGYLEDIEFN
ncbi:MAG: sulfatase [Bacteroidota bacterium]